MSALAKQAREKMKAKAKSFATERDMKVDSSDWTPAEPLNADVKTGARPVGKARLYKKGGKVVGNVDGKAAPVRADRARRKSGGKVEATEKANAYINRDVRAANEEREGKKHIGGFKKGGAPKRAAGGGVKDKQALGKIDPTPKRGAAQHYKKGGKTKKADGGFLENIKNSLMGKGYADGSTWEKKQEAPSSSSSEDSISPAQYAKERAMARKNMRGSTKTARAEKMAPSQYSREMAMAYENERPTMRGSSATPVQSESFMKKGGKVRRADGGNVKSGLDESDARMSIVKPRLLTFGQNTVVPGQKKGGKVEKKTLPEKANKKHADVAKRMNRASGGMVDIGAMKKAPKAGKKGKTNINIVINAGKRDQAAPMDMAAMAPPMPAGVPIPMPAPPAGAPPMGGMGMAPPMMPSAPPAAPPAAPMPAPGAMPRKRGGRVAKQIGGAMGFNPAQAGLMAGAAPSFRPASIPMAGARAPAPAPAMPSASGALQFAPQAPMQRFVPGAPVNIAGPGIRPVQDLEINRAATTYPTKQLLTAEQMAMIPTQSISLQEALRLFLPPQQAAQQAATMSRQPMPQNMTPAESGAEQARRVQQAMAQEQARKEAEARAAAERAAAEKAAAEKAAAERAAAERAAAAKQPQQSGPSAADVMRNYYLYKMMTSDRSMKTGVGRKSGGSVK